jgi:hypothetical protein
MVARQHVHMDTKVAPLQTLLLQEDPPPAPLLLYLPPPQLLYASIDFPHGMAHYMNRVQLPAN